MNRDLGWRDAKSKGEESNRRKKKQNKSRWHASEGLCSRAKYLISWGLGHFKAFGC